MFISANSYFIFVFIFVGFFVHYVFILLKNQFLG